MNKKMTDTREAVFARSDGAEMGLILSAFGAAEISP